MVLSPHHADTLITGFVAPSPLHLTTLQEQKLKQYNILNELSYCFIIFFHKKKKKVLSIMLINHYTFKMKIPSPLFYFFSHKCLIFFLSVCLFQTQKTLQMTSWFNASSTCSHMSVYPELLLIPSLSFS